MCSRRSSRIRVSDGGDLSYLDMWKTAMDRERKSMEFKRIVENSRKGGDDEEEEEDSPEALERKSNEFKKILEFSPEERDRIQRMQVIDRASAAIAAARALLKENPRPQQEDSGEVEFQSEENEENQQGGKFSCKIHIIMQKENYWQHFHYLIMVVFLKFSIIFLRRYTLLFYIRKSMI